jgi:hypothetical protein
LKPSSRIAQQAIHGVFARPTQTETGERYAELCDGEQAAGISQQVESALRASLPLFGQFAEARLAHGDERNLGRRKESVGGQNEDENEKSYPIARGAKNGTGMAKALAE